MESKYLVFDKYVTPGRKMPSYGVKNKQSLITLGAIYFYPAWRKYVFEAVNDTIFDASCLTDIVNFMQEIQTEWRNSLKEKKEAENKANQDTLFQDLFEENFGA